MREILLHRDGGVNDRIKLTASATGPGGASQYYQVENLDSGTGYCFRFVPEGLLTNELLLAIVADRLDGFQTGPCGCNENYEALVMAMAALESLKKRTLRRRKAGLENKMEETTAEPFLRREGDTLIAGSVTISLDVLRKQWGSWSLIEQQLKWRQPVRLEPAEEALLASLGDTSAAVNGLSELKQAISRCR